jgi:prepilin-type N-terminal cleavage/methylation domain-containing protein
LTPRLLGLDLINVGLEYMRTKRRIYWKKGFTLIEVLVALAIIAFTTVGLFSLLPLSTKMLMAANTRETGKDLATYEMEYVKSLPWNSSYTPAPIPAGYNGYSVSVTVDNTLPDPNLQKITVSITQTVQTLVDSPASRTEVRTLEGYKGNW